MFINYAHRGASSYRPENTMAAFRLGLEMGANGIETDIHRTKDGVLVLFHDDTLDRVTGVQGKIKDFTYEELRQISVKMYGMEEKIPTFEEFLQEFSKEDISFAIEFKQHFTEQDTIDMLNKYDMREKTVLTSFKFNCLTRALLYAPEYAMGYLTNDTNELVLKTLESLGIGQVCPQAKLITAEHVKDLHDRGFSVRAWGVSDEEVMAKVYASGADGMTVNFPDKLTELMRK